MGIQGPAESWQQALCSPSCPGDQTHTMNNSMCPMARDTLPSAAEGRVSGAVGEAPMPGWQGWALHWREVSPAPNLTLRGLGELLHCSKALPHNSGLPMLSFRSNEPADEWPPDCAPWWLRLSFPSWIPNKLPLGRFQSNPTARLRGWFINSTPKMKQTSPLHSKPAPSACQRGLFSLP